MSNTMASLVLASAVAFASVAAHASVETAWCERPQDRQHAYHSSAWDSAVAEFAFGASQELCLPADPSGGAALLWRPEQREVDAASAILEPFDRSAYAPDRFWFQGEEPGFTFEGKSETAARRGSEYLADTSVALMPGELARQREAEELAAPAPGLTLGTAFDDEFVGPPTFEEWFGSLAGASTATRHSDARPALM